MTPILVAPGTTLPGVSELRENWSGLDAEERLERFHALPAVEAADLFVALPTHDQAGLIRSLLPEERRTWLRMLDPDDLVDLIQDLPQPAHREVLAALDPVPGRQVAGLLAYAEDRAGGLMDPRFASVRQEATADEALAYLRRRAKEGLPIPGYLYIVDDGRLIGVVSVRALLAAPPARPLREVMTIDVVSVRDDLDQEQVAKVIADNGLVAVPVVGEDGRLRGVVTADDAMAAVAEEATEDLQKFGGLQALEGPYLAEGFAQMLRKRAGWLSILFVSEMLTATAMSAYQDEIQRVVVLAAFVPLIISSGGNSGSQASTLVIRALSLGEISLRDWWRVCRRELASGIALGAILGVIALIRVLVWQAVFASYGALALQLALTVSLSLVGVVLFGTLAGAMLPFLLRKLGADPASASGPFVATLVDVSGLVIYFTVASWFLAGVL